MREGWNGTFGKLKEQVRGGHREGGAALRYEDVKRQTERHQDRKQKDEGERELRWRWWAE